METFEACFLLFLMSSTHLLSQCPSSLLQLSDAVIIWWSYICICFLYFNDNYMREWVFLLLVTVFVTQVHIHCFFHNLFDFYILWIGRVKTRALVCSYFVWALFKGGRTNKLCWVTHKKLFRSSMPRSTFRALTYHETWTSVGIHY